MRSSRTRCWRRMPATPLARSRGLTSRRGGRHHDGVRVVEEVATSVELHVALEWGWTAPKPRPWCRLGAEHLARTARLPSVQVDVVVDGRRGLMHGGVAGLTRTTIDSARRSVATACGGSPGEPDGVERALERACGGGVRGVGDDLLDEEGRLLGSMQYGPSHLFPRAADLPAGPPSDDAVLVTCAYLSGPPRVGREVPRPRRDRRVAGPRREGDRGVRVPLPGRGDVEERFLVHRTVFPRDFLDEFGFTSVRSQGHVEFCRLELGGLVPVEEGRRAKVLRVVQEAFTPTAPSPVPRR